MKWLLFEGSLLNMDDFSRFFLEEAILFGICKSGRKIYLREYPSSQEARDGLCDLFMRLELENKKEEQNGSGQAQVDQPR